MSGDIWVVWETVEEISSRLRHRRTALVRGVWNTGLQNGPVWDRSPDEPVSWYQPVDLTEENGSECRNSQEQDRITSHGFVEESLPIRPHILPEPQISIKHLKLYPFNFNLALLSFSIANENNNIPLILRAVLWKLSTFMKHSSIHTKA